MATDAARGRRSLAALLWAAAALLPCACSDRPAEAAGRGGSSGPVLAMPATDPGALWSLEDFELTDQSGHAFGLADLAGTPWVASFIFTRCAGPCPRISADMAWLQGRLEESRARLVTITVDPAYDTPAVLERYAQKFGADPQRWFFLTGTPEEVEDVVRRVFFQPLEVMGPSGEHPTHSTRLVVVDGEGRVRGVYDTTGSSGRRKALDRLLFLEREAGS